MVGAACRYVEATKVARTGVFVVAVSTIKKQRLLTGQYTKKRAATGLKKNFSKNIDNLLISFANLLYFVS